MISKLKRLAAPKTWPIGRKGNIWVTSPTGGHNKELSIPLSVVLKELLNICHSKKELRSLLNDSKVLVDGRVVKDKSYGLTLLDILTVKGFDNSWYLGLNTKGKLEVLEYKDASKKIVKIIGKKIVKGNKLQFNLHDGRNLITDKKASVGDSFVIEVPSNKILKHLPLDKNAHILIIGGSHLGETATVKDFREFKGPQQDRVVLQEGKTTFETLMDYVLVIEK